MVQSQLPGWHFRSWGTLRASSVHFSQLELCASGNYLHRQKYCRILSSQGFALPGGWKYQAEKKKDKKVLYCFSSANCSLRQVIVVKNIHKYSDSGLTKYQDIGIYSSVSSPKLACLFQAPLHQQMFSVSQKIKVKPGGSQGPKEQNKNVPCVPHEPAHYTLLSTVETALVIYGESKLKSHLFTEVLPGSRVLF